MARGIKLTKLVSEQDPVTQLRSYRLRIEASDAVNMPEAIFLHEQVITDAMADPNLVIHSFVTVATPFDCSAYPENEPYPQTDKPFYRLSYVDLILENTAQVNDSWHVIKSAVVNLVQAFNRLDSLVIEEEFQISTEAD